MGKRITVDPITRIEGHLRIDVEVDNGSVSKAWASGQMWRGIETMLKGRNPKDAWVFAQRFCGVCTTVHAISSIRSVEDALDVELPVNAQMIRNIMIALHSLQDHIVHFYHLSALDWVDITSALEADPAKAASIAQSLSPWPGNSVTEFAAVKERLKGFVSTGKLGIFSSGYWGHKDMRLEPEINLIAVAHYLKALDYQRKAAQAVAILGSKNPHIQNLVVGGVATAVNVDNPATLNVERLALLRSLTMEVKQFVNEVYYPDVLAIASFYKDWFKYGRGVDNYLATPDFPLDGKSTSFGVTGGTIMNGDLSTFRESASWNDDYIRKNITESVAHAWYEDGEPLHPWKGETEPSYGEFDDEGKYTWVKAPRLEGKPAQVGPLAQILVNYAAGDEKVTELVNSAASTLGIGLDDLHSTMGRHYARAARAVVMADKAVEYIDALEANIAAGDQTYANDTELPDGEYSGVGFHEAPRGLLSHWLVMRDKKIFNYQAVVPSTWNAGPRDEQGTPGPYEASLVGNPVLEADKPLEVIRTVHSFDPCLACAVHTIDPEKNEIVKVQVR
ncbi:nickel-dependent hydrogenase large subunit [Limisalsivibrio acetivorans]|uniref:nickel-dependent hydrogenase large subunit n=1 Tax=Limisalsivibrio acetivorans TaxID=1304888 RepID=UPI0003B48869|nr:nickel-dependent hydrogenase large subunit [Limisalsivibrio acetivorans]